MKGTNLNPTLIQRLKDNSAGPQGLHHFDLTNSNAGPRELTVISDAIKSNFQSIEGIAPLISIDISGNQLCGIDSMMAGLYDSDGLNDFTNTMISMAKMSRLRKINISRNYLDVKGFMLIANILNNGPSSLIELNLRNCGGNAKATEKIFEALKNNKSLLTLDLNQNEIGPESAEVLSEALNVNKRLKQLSISDCNISADISIIIFKGMTNNSTLEILNISDNYLCDTGAEALGNLLKSNNSLKHLDIQENRISSDGLYSISRGLIKNKGLIFLGLQWNDISNEGAAKLGEALTFNNTLKSVHILGNHIDAEGLSHIIQGSLTTTQRPIDVDLGFASTHTQSGPKLTTPQINNNLNTLEEN